MYRWDTTCDLVLWLGPAQCLFPCLCRYFTYRFTRCPSSPVCTDFCGLKTFYRCDLLCAASPQSECVGTSIRTSYTLVHNNARLQFYTFLSIVRVLQFTVLQFTPSSCYNCGCIASFLQYLLQCFTPAILESVVLLQSPLRGFIQSSRQLVFRVLQVGGDPQVACSMTYMEVADSSATAASSSSVMDIYSASVYDVFARPGQFQTKFEQERYFTMFGRQLPEAGESSPTPPPPYLASGEGQYM